MLYRIPWISLSHLEIHETDLNLNKHTEESDESMTSAMKKVPFRRVVSKELRSGSFKRHNPSN